MQGVLRHGYQSKSGRSSADGVHRPWIAAARAAGFTLFELLIVIALIVFLAGTAAPAIRSLSRTAQINSGARQMIDHLMIARSLAISGRRVVYVIFLPGGIGTHYNSIMNWPYPDPRMRERDLVQLTNLVRSQYQAYAFFSPRTVGDQPGRPHPRYLSEWHRLPEGTIFVPDKFQDVGGLNQWFVLADSIPPEQRPLPYTAFPFPSEYSPPLRLPFVAFDPFGRLYYPTERLPGSQVRNCS